MNLSNRAVAEYDGEADDDRDEKLELALTHDVKLGWREGEPLVYDGEGIPLDEDVNDAYEGYYRNEDILVPEAGTFLTRLAEHSLVTTVEDIATELGMDEGMNPRTKRETIRKALDIHGIEITKNDDDVDRDETDDVITLPNGESWDVDNLRKPVYEDSRLLTQLGPMNGFSIDEVAIYISNEIGERVDESDVQQGMVNAGILEGTRDIEKESSSNQPVAHQSRVHKA